MKAANPDRIDLPALMHELVKRYGRAPSYHSVWFRLAGGRLPGERVGRLWLVRRSDIPRIAKVLGLTDPPAAA